MCVYIYTVVLKSLSPLHCFPLFEKNDIAGQKTISRDKKRYRGTYRFYVTVLSP